MPPYHSQHEVVPAPWSYPEKAVTEDPEAQHKSVDLSDEPPSYHPEEQVRNVMHYVAF